MRIANSEGVRDSLVQRVGLRRESIRVIYNGVDAVRLEPTANRDALRSRFGWPDGAPILLSVGRLVREKNYRMLLNVIASLRERIPTLRAAIAGWGAAEQSLHDFRAELDLTDCVEFLGRREDVADLMAAADIFVMPSLSEGFSNALLEAMWVGMPVVATRVNGAVEIIRNGENGLLVDIGDEAPSPPRLPIYSPTSPGAIASAGRHQLTSAAGFPSTGWSPNILSPIEPPPNADERRSHKNRN